MMMCMWRQRVSSALSTTVYNSQYTMEEKGAHKQLESKV
jgi:hypothetical protein